MKVIRAAVVGIGFLGIQHIEAIRRIPNTEVVAIVGRSIEKTKKQAETLGVKQYFDNIMDLVNSGIAIDVVHNCTPNALHYRINKQIIENNMHVFAEKPFTINSHESEELVELAKEHNIKGGVNFNYRQNILVEEMKEQLNTGKIGKAWFVYVEYIQDWLLYQTDYDWRMDPELGGDSRAIADIGSHCFDTIQYIVGERIVSVEAKTFRKFDERSDNGVKHTITNEDAAIIFITFESGLNGLVRLSQVTAGKKNDFRITIEADEQTLVWEQERPDRLWIGHRDTPNLELYASEQYLSDIAGRIANLPNGHPVGWHDAVTQGIRNFYEDILTDSNKNYVNFEVAHYNMKLIDACLLSAKNKEVVYLT